MGNKIIKGKTDQLEIEEVALMKKTKKQQHDNETVIIGHHFGQHKYFGQKGYTWRIRHHKTRGQLYLKVGQLAWVNVTGQKNQALVIITDIKTVTELADRRQARRYKTVKKISSHSVWDLNPEKVAKYEQFMANQTSGR